MAAQIAGALVTVGAVVTAVAAVVSPPRTGPLAHGVALAVPVLLVATGVLLLTSRGRRSSPLLTLIPLGALLAIAGLDIATQDATVSGHIFFCCPVLYAASQLRTGAAVLTTVAAVALDALVAFTLTPPHRALTDVAYMTTALVAITIILVSKGRRHDAIVAELHRREEALTRQATHDVLTGLPNRMLFHQRVRQALNLHAHERPQTPPEVEHRQVLRPHGIGVLFCDLDGFKAVNDSLGHRAGDELLLTVADRLRSSLRQQDVVARLGGDEFAVLIHDADRTGARAVADRLLAALAVPVPVAGQHVHVGVSIGITLAGPGARDVDTLVREADVAMYEAKAGGRGRAVFFEPAMLAAQVESASLLQDLHGAVSRGELSVHYQPVVDLTTGAVDGLEALARWAHPRRGSVSPATFIPLAEQAGLIDEIGAYVLAEVSRDVERFAAAAGRQVSVGVNVSASQLASATILDAVPTGRTESMQLLLEVTESTLVRADVVPVLEELRRRGVRIAMDDFGVGRSSIAALRLMPVDVVKLDSAFTADIVTDPRAAAVVRAVAVMTHELDLALVAEGIETTEQRDALMSIGCRYGQGYLVARPMSATATCDHLRRGPVLAGPGGPGGPGDPAGAGEPAGAEPSAAMVALLDWSSVAALHA